MMHSTEDAQTWKKDPLLTSNDSSSYPATTTVISSPLPQQSQQQSQYELSKSDAPIAVETVHSKDSDGDDSEQHQQHEELHDRVEKTVATIIHWMLFFFVLVFVGAILLIVKMMLSSHASSSGLVVVAISFLLSAIVIGFVSFVYRTMQASDEWMNHKIRTIQDIATAVVYQEVRNFQLDYYEHILLLTDATTATTTENSKDNDNGEIAIDSNGDQSSSSSQRKTTIPESSPLPITTTFKPKKKHRSVVFAVVKPFLKLRNFKKRRKGKQHIDDDGIYVPPTV